MKIIWTQEALTRLKEIQDYIGQNNPGRAKAFINILVEKTKILSSNPEIGRIVPETAHSDIREIIHKNYRIVYRRGKNHIEILTVFEGHKLFRADELKN
ncbi:type II toxin-antitoxin system mRNA interferase toxin, RelE/StbE family [candidate division KSB1 bacterium]|nr:type II toxin-antitoxin system mRNA interferase toxin, RelE/StbE family [candidate division KSB1 bacterium]